MDIRWGFVKCNTRSFLNKKGKKSRGDPSQPPNSKHQMVLNFCRPDSAPLGVTGMLHGCIQISPEYMQLES